MDKKPSEELKEKLFYKGQHAALTVSEETAAAAEAFCEGYKAFINASKTEREAVRTAVRMAEERGFVPFEPDKKYNPGDRVYLNNRGKALLLAVIGSEPIEKGVNIAAAHIDSPRIDLKPNPVFEDGELAYFKTHYYGGTKKYQWTVTPLALHGVVVKADGEKVEVCLGEKEEEPCFLITDLLPHLAAEQCKRPLSEGIKGEELNILIGSRPFKEDEGSEMVKLNILKLLHEKYGIIEGDFLSAELTLVPAAKARDLGFDRSMIAGYGHDDRVCAYPALMAALDTEAPRRTVITVLADKEEIGSEGNTGMKSRYLTYFINDLAKAQGSCGYRVLSNSRCLSADVNAAFDPTFPDVSERRNCAMLNHGVVITKYTGSRGKSGTNDASAEYMGEIRRMLEAGGVVWQIGELGKVDAGGGGTVAMYIANLNVDTVDLGVPVLSMHAPCEVVAKLDVYMAWRAMMEFYKG